MYIRMYGVVPGITKNGVGKYGVVPRMIQLIRTMVRWMKLTMSWRSSKDSA